MFKSNILERFCVEINKVYGVGVCDSKTTFNGIPLKSYKLWCSMLERCYCDKFLQTRQTYIGCYVSDNFKSYQYFKDWCHEQIGYGNKGWQLDKDFLSETSKAYSEYSCCFIPQELNSFITKSNKIRGEYIIGVTWCKRKKLFTSSIKVSGINKNLGYYDNEWSAFLAYKQAKENRAKELAKKWRGQIDDRVYEKLINYKVLLTD